MASMASTRLPPSRASSFPAVPARATSAGPSSSSSSSSPTSLTPPLRRGSCGAGSLRAARGQLCGNAAALLRDPFQLHSVSARRRPQRRGAAAILESSGMGPHMFDEFNEADQEFVPATLIPAMEVKSGSDGFLVKMADGSLLQCAHNSAEGNRLPDYAAQPAMVLKLQDGSDILLPLIVLEHPRATLMEAMKNVPLARPTIYLVIRDMIELMGYELKLVRVTHRVCEAYYARIYLAKAGDESGHIMSLDLRPSDAINLAVRANVPIQVSKALAVSDGVRQVSMVPRGAGSRPIRAVQKSYHFTFTAEDRPDTHDLVAADEFALVQLLEKAAREERFHDAAAIRDQLKEFRGKQQKET